MSQIYLISPPKIEIKTFLPLLNSALKTNLVPTFQLRLKDYQENEIVKIAREVQKICRDNNCLFLLNDFFDIALELGLVGVHLGENDGAVAEVRKKSPKNFIIGASCYNSRHLAVEAAEDGADYVAFGAFFPTTTKVARSKANVEILEWASEMLNLPNVAIGGITDQNAGKLTKAGADFVAVISYVWDHPLGVEVALKNLWKSFSHST